MQRVKYLSISFDAQIAQRELPLFRGAIIDKANRENILFHNHDGEGFRYAYPLIQYKTMGKRPAIVCVGEGTDSIHHLFQSPSSTLHLHERPIPFKIDKLQLNEFTLQVWDKEFSYEIQRWLPLQGEKYKDYIKNEDLSFRIKLLNSTLRGNILSMAKGLGCFFDKEITVKINNINAPYIITYKNQKLMAFDASFKSNVWLPNYLGLGKGAALGFGMVRGEIRKLKEHKNDE